MQKYHDEPKQYKGYLKSALIGARRTVMPLGSVANGRLRHRRIGDARVSKADGSQVIVKLFAARGRLR